MQTKYICILVKLHVHAQLVFLKLRIIFLLYTTAVIVAAQTVTHFHTILTIKSGTVCLKTLKKQKKISCELKDKFRQISITKEDNVMAKNHVYNYTVNRELNQQRQECNKFAHLIVKRSNFSHFPQEFCTLHSHSHILSMT